MAAPIPPNASIIPKPPPSADPGLTAPILVGGKAIGVAQVSRKGENPRDAGPDFTPADLRHAQEIFDGVAEYLLSARPPAY